MKFKYWGSDNIVLHERDLRRSDKINDDAVRSKYERLRGERRKSFMEELSDLLAEAEFNCFCVVVDKLLVPRKYKAFDPYHIGLSRGFRQINTYLKLHFPDELEKELHIVFEKRGRNEDAGLSRAYQQIMLQGSLFRPSYGRRFSNFRLELMDKKNNSTGLQITDLTARPIGNHYLATFREKSNTDRRAFDIIQEKLHYCSGGKCEIGKYDVFHEGL